MSKIKYSFQFEKEAKLFLETENYKKNVLKEVIVLVKRTIENIAISSYFTKEFEVICEKEIFTKNKEIIVPDRVVISTNNKYTIMEYKTGEKRDKDIIQIKKYANTLTNMGLNVENNILVYVGDSIEVIEV
jgi:CRISPR/Cas system-associated exonuclease Cas4 (RecB family)